MIYTAFIQDGGLFIPNVSEKSFYNQSTIKVDLRMLLPEKNKNDLPKSMTQAVGILSKDNIDGVKYQNELRDEWGS